MEKRGAAVPVPPFRRLLEEFCEMAQTPGLDVSGWLNEVRRTDLLCRRDRGEDLDVFVTRRLGKET